MIVESEAKVILSGEHCVLYGSGILVCSVAERLVVRYLLRERRGEREDVFIKGKGEKVFFGYFLREVENSVVFIVSEV